MVNIKRFTFNPIQENTYLIWDKNSKEAILIDCGALFSEEREELSSFIEESELHIKYILNTHLHFDHTFGVHFAVNKYGTSLGANKADAYLLGNNSVSAARFGIRVNEPSPKIGFEVEEGMIFKLGEVEVAAIHVPGHTPGHMVFYCKQANALFTGDVLFSGSIGRTDLPGGDYDQLISSIKEKLMTLPDQTVVYPGHSETTTIGKERSHNTFLR
ncbi:MAG: MBL fold metallo-hydrolase [Bacteroidales bacterium]